MLSRRKFRFCAPNSTEIEVEIETNGDADLITQYGHYTWRCAEALSAYLSMNPTTVHGKHILELGAGTGLCGLVSALLGARHVTFSDADHTVEENLVLNATLSQVTNYSFSTLDWKSPCYKWPVVKFDLLLAADCLFAEEVYEPFVRATSFLLHTRPETFMITSIEDREDILDVWLLFEKYQLKSELLEGTHVDTVKIYRITVK